jgi:hypothetical protein
MLHTVPSSATGVKHPRPNDFTVARFFYGPVTKHAITIDSSPTMARLSWAVTTHDAAITHSIDEAVSCRHIELYNMAILLSHIIQIALLTRSYSSKSLLNFLFKVNLKSFQTCQSTSGK